MNQTYVFAILQIIFFVLIISIKSVDRDLLSHQRSIIDYDHHLCIIVRTHLKKYDYLLTSLLSLNHNSRSKPSVYVIDTGTIQDHDRLDLIIADVNSLSHTKIASILELTNVSSSIGNTYGYVHTDLAVEKLLEEDSSCNYFMITNGDNFYISGFSDKYIDPLMKQGYELIGFGFVSHHFEYLHFETEFRVGRIDLGAFVVRRDVIKKVENRFKHVVQDSDDFFTADGQFVEKVSKTVRKKIMLKNVLLIHE